MLINLSEGQIRALVNRLYERRTQENDLMGKTGQDFASGAFHNGRAGAFGEAAEMLLAALCDERQRKSAEKSA